MLWKKIVAGKEEKTVQSFLPAWRRKRRSKYNTSILRKCKHFCGSPKVQTGSGCLAQIWNSKIILAGIIPQNDSCSDENNICTNSFATRARSECVCVSSLPRKAEKMQPAPQIRCVWHFCRTFRGCLVNGTRCWPLNSSRTTARWQVHASFLFTRLVKTKWAPGLLLLLPLLLVLTFVT